MPGRHADVDAKPAQEYLVNVVAQIRSLYIERVPSSEWVGVLNKLITVYCM